MTKLIPSIIALAIACSAFGQTCEMAAIETQQRILSRQVMILHGNFLTFWNLAYPNGAPFQTRDKTKEREEAWNPQFKAPKDVPYLNNGLGCVIFLTKANTPSLPSICAPLDIQAQLAMESLREDWSNSLNVADENHSLKSIANSIPMLWGEERMVFCIARPNGEYIGLSDSLERCTPKE
jgi:hypothetical protein